MAPSIEEQLLAKYDLVMRREQIFADIDAEREHQLQLGYTYEHDIEHGGLPHLLDWACRYVHLDEGIQKLTADPDRPEIPLEFSDDLRPTLIKALGLLVAAVELLDHQSTTEENVEQPARTAE